MLNLNSHDLQANFLVYFCLPFDQCLVLFVSIHLKTANCSVSVSSSTNPCVSERVDCSLVEMIVGHEFLRNYSILNNLLMKTEWTEIHRYYLHNVNHELFFTIKLYNLWNSKWIELSKKVFCNVWRINAYQRISPNESRKMIFCIQYPFVFFIRNTSHIYQIYVKTG